MPCYRNGGGPKRFCGYVRDGKAVPWGSDGICDVCDDHYNPNLDRDDPEPPESDAGEED